MSEITDVGAGLADGDEEPNQRQARVGTESSPPADDLAVLFPDVEIEVRLADGSREKVTVRELRFGEYIKYAAELARVLVAIRVAFGKDVDYGVIIDALASCQEDVVTLALAATGKDRAWFDALPAEQGEVLLIAFWQANKGFFLRRLLGYPALQLKAHAGELAGAASSPPLPDAATGQAS